MFINPKVAIDKGWISGIVNSEKQIQPNAIDFELSDLKILGYTHASLSEETKTMRIVHDAPINVDTDTWTLEQGRVYDGSSSIYVNLPDGVAAILFTRSTLARNGVFLMSGLYDSGYKGHIGFTMYPMFGPTHIKRGTRVGQIAFVEASAATLYAGQYNTEQGQHWTESRGPN